MIESCNLDFGFELQGTREKLLFWKWVYWKNGISCREFRRERISDIKDVIEIDNAIIQKEKRERKVQEMLHKLK